MRPIIAIMIWIILVGGLVSYMNARDTVAEPVAISAQTDQADYKVIVTTSFRAERDTFAPDTQDSSGDALILKLNGMEILSLKDSSVAGQSITVDKITGLLIGANEFLLEVNPSHKNVNTAGAVRVQLFRFHSELMDRTFWADPGARIVSTFRLDVEPVSTAGDQNEH